MTKEEAIAFFKDMSECTYGDCEPIEMAIKALEKEPCEDCISRQSAINAMLKIEQDDVKKYGCSIPEGFDSNPAINALNNLPSVIPKGVTVTDFADKCRERGREKVLDKITDEIEKLNYVDYGSMYSFESHQGAREMKADVLQIIDKYKAESEE